jgi:hypothetical protein
VFLSKHGELGSPVDVVRREYQASGVEGWEWVPEIPASGNAEAKELAARLEDELRANGEMQRTLERMAVRERRILAENVFGQRDDERVAGEGEGDCDVPF